MYITCFKLYNNIYNKYNNSNKNKCETLSFMFFFSSSIMILMKLCMPLHSAIKILTNDKNSCKLIIFLYLQFE